MLVDYITYFYKIKLCYKIYQHIKVIYFSFYPVYEYMKATSIAKQYNHYLIYSFLKFLNHVYCKYLCTPNTYYKFHTKLRILSF